MGPTKTTKTDCPYTSVYKMLVENQNGSRKSVHINTVHKYIQNTPGLLFSPGTTVPKLLKKLEDWQLIKIEGHTVKVIDSGKSLSHISS